MGLLFFETREEFSTNSKICRDRGYLMKHRVLAFFVCLLFFTPHWAKTQAAVITQWSIETGPHTNVVNTATFSRAADVGTGTLSGVHASAATDWTFPSGNGSSRSISSNNWGVGDYWQFSSSTTGFENISLSWSQTSSGSGPRDFRLAYSVNGGGFTNFTTYQVSNNSGGWSGVSVPGDIHSVSLTGIFGLNNAASVVFQLINDSTSSAAGGGGVVAGNGTSRIDDFTINGSVIVPAAVPEPTSMAFLGSLLVASLIRTRMGRRSTTA